MIIHDISRSFIEDSGGHIIHFISRILITFPQAMNWLPYCYI